jgi:poly(3-hydroxybutyrate) depolymerase
MRGLSRRTVLLGGALGALAVATGGAYELVEADVLPGRIALDRSLGRCGSNPPVPAARAQIQESSFRSAARGREVSMVLAAPPGSLRGLPVVVVMHGLGGNAHSMLDLHLDRYLVAAGGVPPFALVGVDGGDTYWHRRASGDDPVTMIASEVLPRLRRLGLRTDRIGALGWSMGGYGALLLGQTLGPSRVAAVSASSPAVFTSYAHARTANASAFDGAADFAAHDVLSGLDRLRGVAVSVDCGHSDPFAPATAQIIHGLGHPAGGLFEGCHDGAYWSRRGPAGLAFVGTHLR